MPITHISNPFYKGLFVLVLIFIILEYLFSTISDTKSPLFFNTTKLKTRISHTEKFHGPPLLKTLFRHSKSTNSSAKNGPNSNVTVSPTSFVVHSASNLSNVWSLFGPNTTTAAAATENAANSSIIITTLTPLCPDISPNLRGRIEVIKSSVPTVQELERKLSWLKPGGHWSPDTCRVEKKVALIIPFRCRGEHLLLFLQHMHPFLKRQLLDYTTFIIEQDGDGPFNRATLMNVGYKEALKIRNFDCFIFHDIDLLPEDDRNLYTCPEQPRHMSVAVDIFKYRLPYREIFGGVSAITREHFKLLNGFSNSFWGWGGEDDDMSNRIKHHHLYISRYPINIARYTMLTHKKDKPSPNRYDVLKQGKDRFDKDGLNNLKYRIVQTKNNLLYTWLLVGVDPPS